MMSILVAFVALGIILCSVVLLSAFVLAAKRNTTISALQEEPLKAVPSKDAEEKYNPLQPAR
jgi:hypothetical protein